MDWDMTVKLRYDEVPSDTFLGAFDMDKGQWDIYQESSVYYLIQAADKEPIEVPPMDEVYGDIKERIRQRKLYGDFERWLGEKRKSAKIDIDDNILRGVR